MLALKMLLMVAGVLMLAAACGDSAVWALAADSLCNDAKSWWRRAVPGDRHC